MASTELSHRILESDKDNWNFKKKKCEVVNLQMSDGIIMFFYAKETNKNLIDGFLSGTSFRQK